MSSRLTTRRLLAGYALWIAFLVTMHYVFWGQRADTAVLIDVSGAAAILVGVGLYRPARRIPWLLVAAANLVGAVGLVTAHIVAAVTHAPVPFPSFADAIYLLEYPLFVAGLLFFIRSKSPMPDVRSLIDALVLTVALTMLSWIFLIAPDATTSSYSMTQRIVAVAYPVGDLLIMLALVRMLAPGTLRGAAAVLITVGTACGIASVVAYDVVETSRHPHIGPLVALGWLAAYAAWGASALHPSMTELTRSVRGRVQDAAPGSLLLLLLASLIPPVYLLIHAIEQRDEDEGVVAIVCGMLYLLMLFRLWEASGSHRRSLIRERTLRMAGPALASAGSAADVAAAVQDAVSVLLPGLPPERAAILAVRDGDYLRAVGPLAPEYRALPADPVGIWLKLVEGDTPKFVSIAEIRAARQGVTPSAPPPDAPVLVSYEGALLCPLSLKDRPVGDPFIGLLEFFGDRRTLYDLAGVLEILAGQAALALERVGLTQQVVRQRGQALFRTLVKDAADVILIVGDDRRVRYATPNAGAIFGDIQVEGALLTDLVALGTKEDVDSVLDLMLAHSGGGISPGYLLQIERLDGRVTVIEVRWSDLRREETVGGLVLTLRDVTEQHELEQELKYRAFHDALTGLPNRSLFAREAGTALEAARAAGRTAGVLFVDLDDFKIVNDTMGHGVGDELLVHVAARLASSIRQMDTAARLGGDEFALLIEDAADPEAVEAFAERIVAAFTEPFTLTEAEVLATATVGVATSEDSGDVDELLRHADLALYAAKGAGKRRWRRYQPVLTTGMLRRREIQAALEDAVKSSAFTLVYQPIVSLDSGQITGFEALVRWPHERWGMMLPGQFISVAEETGLIVPLGAWVLRQALDDLVRWRRGLPRGAMERDDRSPDPSRPHVSVNVSARQFRDPGFVDSVRQALQASGLPPSALLLELTESLLLGGSERVRADMAELKEFGVKLAIDDFGTGYSSLAYLLELPIDVLKIDKTFVTGISSSWRRHALVEGIIRLSRTLDVEVVAEGIENETERELLATMGCQFGQGYLLSVPVDAAAAEAMLRLGHGLVKQLPRQRRKASDGRYLTDL